MSTFDELLAATIVHPDDENRWLILSDWLEEHDDPRRAELLRLHRQLLRTCCEPEKHPERREQQTRLVELLGQGVQPCVPQRIVDLGEDVTMTLALIPPGTFLKGSPPEEKTQHRVTLTKGFFLGVHLVTQAQWQRVMGNNPSHFTGRATLPVDSVSWDDCQKFCHKLRGSDGQPYRLPTEAEWEYACRAGTTTPFSVGETIAKYQANYNAKEVYGREKRGPYRRKTAPVGSFRANAWGLTDMHGNLWEWCQDWYGTCATGDLTNPEGPSSGPARVLRGGSWNVRSSWCRADGRYPGAPFDRCHDYGCRIVFPLD